jgi:hypothetical protein
LSGQWFMMIVGKQWRHTKTSRPLEKLHDWAPKDKTDVARRSSEHSDERVGVSSSTLIVDTILYCRCDSQLRHARINLGFLVSTSVVRLFELYKNNQFWLCFTMFWKTIAENCWSSMVMDLKNLPDNRRGLFLILNNGWFLVLLQLLNILLKSTKTRGWECWAFCHGVHANPQKTKKVEKSS